MEGVEVAFGVWPSVRESNPIPRPLAHRRLERSRPVRGDGNESMERSPRNLWLESRRRDGGKDRGNADGFIITCSISMVWRKY